MDAHLITDISLAVREIKSGHVVAFPTGTVYGLAADVLQGGALQLVRNIKKRPEEKTFTVFLAETYWDDYFLFTEKEKSFLEIYKNKPLTVLLDPKPALSHMAQNGKVGLRVIDHPVMRKLAEEAGVPLTATSANVSGKPPCTSPADIKHQLSATPLAAILDGGQLLEGRVSTIVQIQDGEVKIIRPGSLEL